jgi:GTP 3',8-cyclase
MSLAWRRQLAAIQRSLLQSSTYASSFSLHDLAASGFTGLALPSSPTTFTHARRFAALPQLRPAEPNDQPARREQWRRSLPTPDQAAGILRRSCASPPQPTPRHQRAEAPGLNPRPPSPTAPEPPQLSWEEVVLRAREFAAVRPSLDTVLTDSFGRRHTYLRISLTERCNLRCLYCMPEEGVELTPRSHLLTAAEIERLTRLFARAGVDKVRLTGGEPTLRRDLPDIVRRVASTQGIEAVGLTSNGLVLGRNLEELRQAGLSLLNISLDTLRPDRFEEMTRRQGHKRVLDTIFEADRLGFNPVKVNVVVMRGVNDDEIGDFVDLTKDRPLNVRFIEYMPFDGNVWSRDKLVPYREMMNAVLARIERNTTTTTTTSNDASIGRCADPVGEVAKNFTVPGHRGTVSFVTSMTSAFCGDCNRLRLMADGNLKVCLFGANEVSLRDAIRGGASDEDLLAVISAAVDRKKAAHAGMFELARTKNRAMVKIGG